MIPLIICLTFVRKNDGATSFESLCRVCTFIKVMDDIEGKTPALPYFHGQVVSVDKIKSGMETSYDLMDSLSPSSPLSCDDDDDMPFREVAEVGRDTNIVAHFADTAPYSKAEIMELLQNAGKHKAYVKRQVEDRLSFRRRAKRLCLNAFDKKKR